MEKLSKVLEDIKLQISEFEEVKTQNVLNSFYEAINLLADKIEEVNVKQETIEENIQYIDEDLTCLQEEVFEEMSLEELEDIEDEYVEIKCNSCSNPLFIEKDVFESKKEIPCPFCKEVIKF